MRVKKICLRCNGSCSTCIEPIEVSDVPTKTQRRKDTKSIALPREMCHIPQRHKVRSAVSFVSYKYFGLVNLRDFVSLCSAKMIFLLSYFVKNGILTKI